jgi:hypothetical protein
VAERALFYEGELRDALEGHARGMDREIADAPEEHLMQADEDEWVKALIERYSVEAPELHPDDWWMDRPAEISVDVRYDQMRFIHDTSRPALVPGFRVVVHVPYTGEADVFKYTPSTRTYSAPHADVRQGEGRPRSRVPGGCAP